MEERFRQGALAGLAAGAIMLATAWASFRLGWLPFNPLQVSADILLPRSAAQTTTGIWVGIGVHAVLSLLFGLIYASFFPRANWLLYGLAYGIILEVVTGGIIGPFLGVLPPFWRLGTVALLASLGNRLLYGGVVGYLVTSAGAQVGAKAAGPEENE
ncbi:MAG: YqhR family membrane protein [Bacillota bacterium]|nr:YqhR family membrane protein [Bacillota bacterium]